MRLQVAFEAVGLRAALPVLLYALPLDRTLQALTPRASSRTPRADALVAIEEVTDAMTRKLPLTRTGCLKRALLRYALLRRQGYAAGFVIGVRPGGPDGFEAHAWVTLDGRPVMEHKPLDYRRTFVWPCEA